jgi:hypothetical protein
LQHRPIAAPPQSVCVQLCLEAGGLNYWLSGWRLVSAHVVVAGDDGDAG